MDSPDLQKIAAAIDIGTNTVLLLVADLADGGLNVLREEQRMPRLGKGVDAAGNLSPESMERVIRALTEYKTILETEYPECSEIVVTATSAVRDAHNRQDFIEQVAEKTRFSVQVLSGDEEAAYTFSGALNAAGKPVAGDFFVLDIGGGSTEIALGGETGLRKFHSFDVGCVRFTERYLKSNPPEPDEITRCREAVRQHFEAFSFSFRGTPSSVGVAGTLTTLAAVIQNLSNYDARKVNGFVLGRGRLKKIIEDYSRLTAEQILEQAPEIMRGREDVFFAGLLILDEFIHMFQQDEIVISTGGIRHGALLHKNKFS